MLPRVMLQRVYAVQNLKCVCGVVFRLMASFRFRLLRRVHTEGTRPYVLAPFQTLLRSRERSP